jgi:hypothetical protein
MEIFSYFAGFVILVILIRLLTLFVPGANGNGEEKVSKAIGMFIALLLVSIAWGCIYAFFGYEAKNGFGKAPTPIHQQSQQPSSGKNEPNKSNGNVVKFEDKK